MMSHGRAGQTENEEGDEGDNRQCRQNGGDQAADFAGVGQAPTAGIHGAGVHLLKIAFAHDPGSDAERAADHQAEDAEDENESAAMWFQWLFGLRIDFY